MENTNLTSLRKRVAKAPTGPGIYRWKDAKGTVLYVGKAVNLRERLKHYVQAKVDLSIGPWKLALRSHLADVEWTVTHSDLEALILETNLIKTLKPKYNVMMKDDKNYVYLEVTVRDLCPRIDVVRQMRNPVARYFGPFLSAWEVRRSLEFLQLLLNFEACKRGLDCCNKSSTSNPQPATRNPKPVTRNPEPVPRNPKPCLEYQIGKCNGLCIQAISTEEYRRRIDLVMDFFRGNRSALAKKAKEMMAQAAADRKFERAAKLRDALGFIEHQKEGQIVSDPHGTDLDVIGVALSNNRSLAVILKVRDGKLIGEEQYPLRGQPDSIPEALDAFLAQYTEAQTDLPPVIIVPEEIPDRALLEAWCQSRSGRRLRIIVPERGKKSHLLDLAMTNAVEKLKAQETAWETAARNLDDALNGLKDILKLPALPKRIEGYDISHLGGTETVGSMVVMENGKPANDQYRSFTLKTIKEGEVDDYKSLKEVLLRRLRHIAESPAQIKERCTKEGIDIRKARKADQKSIEKVREQQDCVTDSNAYADTLLAWKNDAIVAMARLQKRAKDIHELRSVWVAQEHRGKRLGHFLVRMLLRRLKRGKVYIAVAPSLEAYYAEVGFRHVMHVPDILIEPMREYEIPNFLVMMYSTQEQKADASLATTPHLLVIDGGKGQLGSALDAMREAGISLPVIGLAKKQEEVFVPGHKDPVIFPNESAAKYLLMRLRDEAHRFSNAHREKRLKHRSIGSALDEVPGIGPQTKTELLRQFKTVTGIKDATDTELLRVLNAAQLQALRKTLR